MIKKCISFLASSVLRFKHLCLAFNVFLNMILNYCFILEYATSVHPIFPLSEAKMKLEVYNSVICIKIS